MAAITVAHVCGDRFQIQTRGQAVLVDQLRSDGVELTVRPPARLEPDQRAAMVAAVDHCAVHDTLRRPPVVRVCEASTVGSRS